MTWFQSKDGDGIVFHKYFTTIPIEVIALALTVVKFDFPALLTFGQV
jgi:hypothetical protein